MLHPDGYATVKSTYDVRGNTTGQSLSGLEGKPAADKDGRHSWEAEYDERREPNCDNLFRFRRKTDAGR